MRLHVVSLPHTQTTRSYDWCAYTAKVRRFASMMHDLGHEVYLYAGPENEARCTEHVPIVNENDWLNWFPGYDPATDVWDGFIVGAPWWNAMNERAIREISERIAPGDTICLIAGRAQQEIADAFPMNRTVEFGVGYAGTFAAHRVFESYAWMHYVAGWYQDDNLRNYDSVIPNSFEKSEFSFASEPGDYLLYLGRMTPRKGLNTVQAIAARGHRVLTAGQGDERIVGAEHLGVVLGGDKKRLLANAKAILVPTDYLEPFGGVAVEAMLSGVPVLSTDWGAFTETNHHGVTGFRCRTLGEWLGALDAVELLDRLDIRRYARERYTTDVAAKMYDRYFAQLRELDRDGWNTEQGRLRAGIFGRYQR